MSDNSVSVPLFTPMDEQRGWRSVHLMRDPMLDMMVKSGVGSLRLQLVLKKVDASTQTEPALPVQSPQQPLFTMFSSFSPLGPFSPISPLDFRVDTTVWDQLVQDLNNPTQCCSTSLSPEGEWLFVKVRARRVSNLIISYKEFTN